MFGYFFYSFGFELSYHQFFTHKTFNTNRFYKILLALIGTFTNNLPIASWVAFHRKHHVYVDTENDPISPLYKSWWYILLFPMFTKFEPKRCLDILRDKDLMFFQNNYIIITLFFWFLMFYLNLFFLYGSSIAVMWTGIWLINYFGHGGKFGNNRKDKLIGILLAVDKNHDLHHKDASKCRFENFDFFTRTFFNFIVK